MPVIVKGTAHVYGIAAGVGAVTNATVVSVNFDSQHANTAETVNEIGNVIERRYDDLTISGTITLKIRSTFVVAAAATQITYNAVVYLVTAVGTAEEAQGFVVITYSIMKSEYITLI